MNDSRWPLRILLAVAVIIALALAVGLFSLIRLSHFPVWLRTALNIFLIGISIFGGDRSRRRIQHGKSP